MNHIQVINKELHTQMTRYFYFIALLFACFALLFFCGCEKIEQTDTSTEVTSKDPEGTITIGLDAGGTTKIAGDIYINDAFNLVGASGSHIVDLGAIQMLSKLSQISADGWATSAPAIKGHGYIAYSSKNKQFYRMYLSTELPDNSGFYVKYQGPFYGRDAIIELSESSINSTSKGLSEVYTFKNTDIIIPKTVKSSSDWCSVNVTSTLNNQFLPNAIHVSVKETLGEKDETASIEISTYEGKTSTVNVNRKAAEGKLALNVTQKTLVIGEPLDLSVSFNGEGISDVNMLTWENSNSSIIKLGSAQYDKYAKTVKVSVTALAAGSSTITVKLKNSDRKATCNISVAGISIKTGSIQNISPFYGELSGKIECSALENLNDKYSVKVGLMICTREDNSWTPFQGGLDAYYAASDESWSEGQQLITAQAPEINNGEFFVSLFYLEPHTTYYYRTFVKLWDYVYLGEIKSFTTPAWNRESKYAIDLGLSVKWASVNLSARGASNEKVSYQGLPYAWGEAWGKYGYGNYNWKSDDSSSSSTRFYLTTYDPKGDGTGAYDNIGSNITGTQYDHATQYWGSDWRTPTKAEWEELISKCKLNWSRGSRGTAYWIVGPNGRSIYLPVCYHISYGESYSDFYWTSTIDTSNSEKAYIFSYDSQSNALINSEPRCNGNYIRPVTNK